MSRGELSSENLDLFSTTMSPLRLCTVVLDQLVKRRAKMT